MDEGNSADICLLQHLKRNINAFLKVNKALYPFLERREWIPVRYFVNDLGLLMHIDLMLTAIEESGLLQVSDDRKMFKFIGNNLKDIFSQRSNDEKACEDKKQRSATIVAEWGDSELQYQAFYHCFKDELPKKARRDIFPTAGTLTEIKKWILNKCGYTYTICLKGDVRKVHIQLKIYVNIYEFENRVFLVKVVLLFMLVTTSMGLYCPESRQTLRIALSCPTDHVSWIKAAEEMNCSRITQSCTSKKAFKYHCVLNAFRNSTVEVCAPERMLLGYCCEFNEHGATLQHNYKASCLNTSNPCTKPYLSSESYKYPECFKMTKKYQMTTNTIMQATTSEDDRNEKEKIRKTQDENESYAVVIVPSVVIPCFAFFVGLVVVYKIKRVRQRRQSKIKKEDASNWPINGDSKEDEDIVNDVV